ncbi:MAG: fusA [Massilibacillus sp.]|jgi:elongation factor G|nr:fusA [Massilibacillus sp.]
MVKEYSGRNLRNIAIVGHGKAGKTSLTESLLFNAGLVNRLGKVDDGTSSSDYEAEEIKRKLSISSALVSFDWQGYKLNFIDTPGYPDFVAEVKYALQAVDSVLVVVSAVAGIEVETEKVWRYSENLSLPRAIYVNKMDREYADFYSAVEQMRVKFGNGVVPIQIPIGKENSFHGVVDLLTMHTKILASDNKFLEGEIPEYLKSEVEDARQKLIEVVAEYNNELLDKYLEGKEITEIEVAAALIDGINSAKIFPILCGSAIKNIGSKKLMNAIVEYMPTPYFKTSIGMEPVTGNIIERNTEDSFSGIVFKTTADPFVGRLSYIKILSGTMKGENLVYNASKEKLERINSVFTLYGKQQSSMSVAHAGDIVVVNKLQETCTGDTLCSKDALIVYETIKYPKPMLMMALKAKNKGDEDKIGNALSKIIDGDQTIKIDKDMETKELLINGIGELHLEITAEKLKRKFGVEIFLSKPAVPYRETIKEKVKIEGKHKKQSGGHGQFGHVWLELEPLSSGSGVEFTESIFGGSVPRQYIPAVEKGTRETLSEGVLAGYPVVDIKVNLYDGSYHNVDSSEMAFKVASALAIRKGVMQAAPVLLEPIYNVKISVPEYYMGDVIGGLNSKRGHILGMDTGERGMGIVTAQVPMAELFKYATDLRSISQGRGSFDMVFSHYEELPVRLATEIITAKKNKD